MNAQTEILLIITVVSVACSIPGVFLVLRRMSMTADAITHTRPFRHLWRPFLHERSDLALVSSRGLPLRGIFDGFGCRNYCAVPRLFAEDASVALSSPLLFSLAVILITLYGSHLHLDTDTVLLGKKSPLPPSTD